MRLQIKNASGICTFSGETRLDGDGYWCENDILPEGASILIEDGVISEVGSFPDAGGIETIDASGSAVVPGFIDPHTHPVFAETREMEFVMRVKGATYLQITKAGGGILTSAGALRDISPEKLEPLVESRLDRMLLHGTTTLEAKSGYGLSTDSELLSLRVLARVGAKHPADVISTFLGAHQVPAEYKEDRAGYIDKVINEMLPAVKAEELAVFCDVFCDEAAFTNEESRQILESARRMGFRLKMHADELSSTGGAELAADLGAVSADHLVAVSDEGMRRMREAGVVPVLLPGTSFFLSLDRHAPARRLISEGLPIALSTDFNPGSSMTESVQMILSLACINLKMTPYEAFRAVTRHGALALGMSDRGMIAPGKKADILVLDTPNIDMVPYNFGVNHVRHVVKDGIRVIDDGRFIFRR